MKRLTILLLILIVALSFSGCGQTDMPSVSTTPSTTAREPDPKADALYLDAAASPEERAKDLLSRMTLEEKAGQMVQGVNYNVNVRQVRELMLGSVLSGGGGSPSNNTIDGWQAMVEGYQMAALETRLGIPILYGVDAVHGHSNVRDAVIFPQNIGLGAANDEDLMYAMGVAVAEEMKLTHTLWNFSPCIAVAQDPRWGRTYESFSSDPALVEALATAYAEGQLDHGIMPTAKHYAGDGGTLFGTGEDGNYLDRGDVVLTHADFYDVHVAHYQGLVDAGVMIIMSSFNSHNGLKMTENEYYLTKVLKGDMGFEGFVVSDWEATKNLSGESFNENVQLAVNAGIDMLMEPNDYIRAREAIIEGVEQDIIPIERVDDAVYRILRVKFEAGLFDDPLQENHTHQVDELGTESYRMIARQLVEKSLVLLKNQQDVLPLQAGQKIYVIGPAMNDIGVQCGGWTLSWQGLRDAHQGGEKITSGTTILEGLEAFAAKHAVEIITNESRAHEADVVILVVGERPYAEWEGDTSVMGLTGQDDLGLRDNVAAIDAARQLGKPTITLIVAGRHVIIEPYSAAWDAIVMCYLPGTQGDGIASVLFGQKDFEGRLPMPWYRTTNQIGDDEPNLLYDIGYGLSYGFNDER